MKLFSQESIMKPSGRMILLTCIPVFFLLTGCATNQFSGEPLQTVDELALEGYLGSWYEIARFQKSFEKNIYGTTAEYSLRDDGRIQVVNSGFKNSLDGENTSV
jgi:lipocalin